MIEAGPSVGSDGAILSIIAGRFYRAVDPRHCGSALAGSVAAGRYSAPGQPTLYLSSSPAGVDAAMIAHRGEADPPRKMLAFEVRASGIADLRSPALRDRIGIAERDMAGDWQAAIAAGATPVSWTMRNAVEALGATGLIDPSRRAPGLWHLVLFRWNVPDAPTVEACEFHAGARSTDNGLS